ncbi:MAG: hypothetical protein KF761_04285 [Salinibacterium sp.]|nr:hypothetical protein [Salinibacterium sp.]
MTLRTESVDTETVTTESTPRRAVSPFYAIAGVAVVALVILGFLVATR